MAPVVTFHKAYSRAPAPMPADKAALGYMPISAFQYCEAMRTASAWGWYVFPPMDIQLMSDGYQDYVAADGQWQALRHQPFDDDYLAEWNRACPEALKDRSPNALTNLPEPGVVQVWTGYFVTTAPGWALSIRPLVNIHTSADFTCYEAIVETDDFAPCPLFVNIHIRRTDREVVLRREFPLFQMQPLPKAAFQQTGSTEAAIGDADFDWDGVVKTLRIPGVSEARPGPGRYGAEIRRKARKAEQNAEGPPHAAPGKE